VQLKLASNIDAMSWLIGGEHTMSSCDSRNGISADRAMSLRDGGRLFAPLAREIVVCSSASGLSPAATTCSAYLATRRFPHILASTSHVAETVRVCATE
jgi:hypothetical protein